MSKKLVSAVLVIGMLSGYSVNTATALNAESIVCERNGSILEFSGHTDSKNSKLMLKIYNCEYSQTEPGGFVYLDTIKTDSSGDFKVEVTMPETLADGSSATGEYIMVYSDGSGQDTSTFKYTIPSEAENLYNKLKSLSADELKEAFYGSLNAEAELAGADMSAYNKLSEDEKSKVCGWFVGKRTENGTENINRLNDCIYVAYISVCADNEAKGVAAVINPSYNGKTYNELETDAKSAVAVYLSQNTYDEYDDINEAFGVGIILGEISAARADDVTALLTDNSSILGIREKSAFTQYSQMSASDKLKTNEAFVKEINGSLTSLSQLSQVLENAVKKVKESSSSGSSSGGGSSSGSASSAPIASKYDAPKGEVKVPDGSVQASFGDISDVEWAEPAINYFAAKGIVNGYNSTTFAPNDPVTREAFVKILLSASGLYEAGHKSSFNDVDADEWYAGYVACAQAKGIVNGISENEFGIGATLTREDMAVIVLRTAQMQGKQLTKIRDYKAFGDTDSISDYAKEAVRTLYCAGMLNGVSDTAFEPQAPLTRAQAVKVLYDVYSGNAIKVSSTKTANISNIAKTEFEESAEFLEAVGILNKPAKEYMPSENVSLGAMVNMIFNLTEDCSNKGDDVSSASEALAYKYGILNEGYNADEQITIDCAIEMLVKAMGYGPFVKNDKFNEKAVEIGLLQGIKTTGNEKIDAAAVMRLLENAAECSPFVVKNVGSQSETVEVLSDTTILEHKKNIYKKIGIVTGNELTTLYSPNGIPEGYIEIDNEKYGCTNVLYGDYLGYRVTYYVHEHEDENTVKYVKSRDENEVTFIESDDFINISDDFKIIDYLNGSKSKSVQLSQSPRVFYNGRFYSGYTKDDFDMDMGSITVIESYNSEMPDMIFITSYETFIVDRVSADGYKIYNKFAHSGVTEKIETEDVNIDIIKNDEQITVSELKEWDVLSIAATKNGTEAYYRIYVSDVREEAMCESFSEEDRTVTSIGFIYDIADVYFDSFAAGKSVGYPLVMGEYRTFALDVFGRVAAMLKADGESEANYAWVINAWAEEDGESFGIRYYDVNKQDILAGKISDKINVNSKRLKSYSEILNSELFDADGKGVAQLVKLELDKDGAVSKIETAESVSQADPSKFTKKKVSTTWTYENRSFNHELFLTETSKILCVPDSDDNYDNYYVLDRILIDTDRVYSTITNVTAYDFDDFMRSEMVVLNYNSKGNVDLVDSLEIFMVDQVTMGVDSEGEVMRRISGSIGNYEAMEFFVVGDEVLPDVQKGDALYVKFDAKGRITHASTVFSLNDVMNSQNAYENAKTVAQSARNSKTQFVSGWVENIELTNASGENMLMLDTTTMLPVLLNGNSSKIIVYDAKTEKTSVEDISALEKGDLVLIRMRYSVIKAIVAVKNLDID